MIFKIIPYIIILASIGTILYLDRKNAEFRLWATSIFSPARNISDHIGQWRASNHDEIIDNSNLFEAFQFGRRPLKFKSKAQTEKFKKLGYLCY